MVGSGVQSFNVFHIYKECVEKVLHLHKLHSLQLITGNCTTECCHFILMGVLRNIVSCQENIVEN